MLDFQSIKVRFTSKTLISKIQTKMEGTSINISTITSSEITYSYEGTRTPPSYLLKLITHSKVIAILVKKDLVPADTKTITIYELFDLLYGPALEHSEGNISFTYDPSGRLVDIATAPKSSP